MTAPCLVGVPASRQFKQDRRFARLIPVRMSATPYVLEGMGFSGAF